MEPYCDTGALWLTHAGGSAQRHPPLDDGARLGDRAAGRAAAAAAARAAMLRRPLPRGGAVGVGAGTDPVVGDPQDRSSSTMTSTSTPRRLGVAGDVAQRLAQRGQQLAADRSSTPVSTGPSRSTRGSNPRGPAASRGQRRARGCADPAGDDPGLLEAEDGGADVLDGQVEVVDGRLDALDGRVGVGADQPDRALQRHPGGEQALDDGVVEVAGDALAVLERAPAPGPGRAAGRSRWPRRPPRPGRPPAPRRRR